MDLKEAINEIPKLVKMLKEKFSGEKQNFKEAKLMDGSIVRYDGDMPVVGVPIMVVSEQGEIPLADGEYQMEDGVTLKVAQGVIAEIVPAEEKVEEAPVGEDMATPSEAPTQASVKRMVESIVKETVFSKEEIEEKLKVLSEIDVVKKENSILKKELEFQKKLLKDTFALVELISGQPVAETKIEKKDGFKRVKHESNLLLSAKELSKQVFK